MAAAAKKKLRVTPTRVAKVLKKARDLMNDQGAHWIQGRLRSRNTATGEVSFCSVGAVMEAAMGDENSLIRREALLVLAESVDPSFKRDGEFFGGVIDTAKGIVIRWNDSPDRHWTVVDKKFAEAQERARAAK
jgi:hypothetical protein